MPSPRRPSVATLFGELAELSPATRAERLRALAHTAPDVAREVAQLLDADAAAGDFFGVHAGDGATVIARPTEGRRIGPYTLERRLGEGGMATVWLAHDARLDRPVALKFLHPARGDGASPAAARARFLVEARAAAALDHPHICAVYDVGETADGTPWIAMAHCAGGSLAERLASGPLAPARAARMGAEVAAALAAAHAQRIVHRDVKPANVLFDAAGAVRLGDFGIAKLAGHDPTAAGLVVGTVAYLAPEQVRGERATPASDLWALGVTLYEALAGRRPFAGASHAALMQAILAAAPEPLADAAPDTPASLAALVHALLDPFPDARPAPADAVARTLASLAAGEDAPETPRRAARASRLAAVAPPAPLTPFVGRARELARVVALLDDARLLTLTGIGGCGKTRLAREVALRAGTATAPAGLAWVDLAAVSEPGAVAGQIAAALGFREHGEAAPLAAVQAGLDGAPWLVVLDNCEHVVHAAAAAVETLLRAAPTLRVLATSREPLGVVGETVWHVRPLARDEARQLFVDRARAASPAFALTAEHAPAVDEICRRLDGLPLAVELAAARVRALTPRQIAERLDDAFRLLTGGSRAELPQHRTLRGTMDWSHALLAPREQALLRRLAVFAGGFSLEAAEAVGGAAYPESTDDDVLVPDTVLDVLAALVDRSLVVVESAPCADGAARYRLLETVRQYAAERLTNAGETAAAEAAHAHWCTALAERAEPHLFAGAGDATWVARVRADLANLRAAAAWAGREPSRVAIALRLGAAVYWCWFIIGQYAEARRRLGAALATVEGAGPVDAVLRGRARTALAFLAVWQGDAAAAAPVAAAAVDDLRGRVDGLPLAAALVAASAARALVGDAAGAREAADAALDAARPLPPHAIHSLARYWQGWAALGAGALDEARAAFEAAAAHGRRIGHAPAIGHPLAMLGRIAERTGDLGAAARHYAEAVTIHAATEDAWGLAIGFEGIARVAARRAQAVAPIDAAQARRAVALLAAAEGLRRRLATVLGPGEQGEADALRDALRAALGDAAHDAAWADGIALTPAAAVALATHGDAPRG